MRIKALNIKKNKALHKKQRILSSIRKVPAKRTFFITVYHNFMCHRCKDEVFGESSWRLDYRAVFAQRMDICTNCAQDKEKVLDIIIKEFGKLYDWMEV